MARTSPFVLLACLGACSSTAAHPERTVHEPSFSASLPAAAVAPSADPALGRGDAGAPNDTTLPVGLGLTFGPSAPMLAAALDFPIDKQITFGPSLQYAFESDLSLASLTGQLKYYLVPDEKNAKFVPYATFGAGIASIDKQGGGADQGFVADFGAGVRLLTGEHYRLGTELRFNWLPDEVAGEDTFFSWELLHVVITF
jgi:hypothetical protein